MKDGSHSFQQASFEIDCRLVLRRFCIARRGTDKRLQCGSSFLGIGWIDLENTRTDGMTGARWWYEATSTIMLLRKTSSTIDSHASRYEREQRICVNRWMERTPNHHMPTIFVLLSHRVPVALWHRLRYLIFKLNWDVMKLATRCANGSHTLP